MHHLNKNFHSEKSDQAPLSVKKAIRYYGITCQAHSTKKKGAYKRFSHNYERDMIVTLRLSSGYCMAIELPKVGLSLA